MKCCPPPPARANTHRLNPQGYFPTQDTRCYPHAQLGHLCDAALARQTQNLTLQVFLSLPWDSASDMQGKGGSCYLRLFSWVSSSEEKVPLLALGGE